MKSLYALARRTEIGTLLIRGYERFEAREPVRDKIREAMGGRKDG